MEYRIIGFLNLCSILYMLQISSLNDMYKRLQDYNTSLQQYNSKLQTELSTANETLKRVESEKAAIAENLSTLRGQYTSLQDQLTLSKVSKVTFSARYSFKGLGNVVLYLYASYSIIIYKNNKFQ